MTAGIALRSSCATDAGLVRSSNQDSIESREPSTPFERAWKGTIWALTDGFGPEDRAMHASRLAARELVDSYWHSAISDHRQRLHQAAERANSLLHTLNETFDERNRVSGATVLAAAITGNRVFLLHAGKSRAYSIRRNRMTQLTVDHTWVAGEVDAGRMTPDEAARHPRRNVVTRAIGVEPTIDVDLIEHWLEPDETLLLCTDGLTRELSDTEIVAILSLPGQDDPAAALVEAANRKGGSDNISVVVLKAIEGVLEPELTIERLSVLQSAGRSLGHSLDLDETIGEVMQELLALLGGEHAAVILCDETGEPLVDEARQFNMRHDGRIQEITDGRTVISGTIVRRVVSTGRPEMISDALSDPAHASQSVVGLSLRSILCVPLPAQERVIGALYLDSSIQTGTFTSDDLDLLVAFAGHAAAAIENARLYKSTADQAERLRQIQAHQRSIIRSMSAALIAVDGRGQVTTWNPVAADIFGHSEETATGSLLKDLLPGTVAAWLGALMQEVRQDNATMPVGHDWNGTIGQRERIYLTARVAILRTDSGDPGGEGFVITINDRTAMVLLEEAREAESRRRQVVSDLFGRYLAPPVVDQLLQAPESVRLGGTRQEVTILFADIRGFTTAAELQTPEETVSLLNHYLSLATSEILAELGTLDKFLGDGLMAIFNAPVEVTNHEAAAIRAALAMQQALASAGDRFASAVGFGIGIHTGEAVVGNIGTPELMNYTAVGDTVNVANRLQSEALLGEVLISDTTWQKVAGQFDTEYLGPRPVKGRSQLVGIHRVICSTR